AVATNVTPTAIQAYGGYVDFKVAHIGKDGGNALPPGSIYESPVVFPLYGRITIRKVADCRIAQRDDSCTAPVGKSIRTVQPDSCQTLTERTCLVVTSRDDHFAFGIDVAVCFHFFRY